ncbi:hypothetical protein I552_0011 [Mycobacterium xenopi 3993]|nr:hypothetical protein I552_0011 [Mycobacterium xenopi 3993]
MPIIGSCGGGVFACRDRRRRSAVHRGTRPAQRKRNKQTEVGDGRNDIALLDELVFGSRWIGNLPSSKLPRLGGRLRVGPVWLGGDDGGISNCCGGAARGAGSTR